VSGVNKKHPYHYTQTGVIIMPLSMIGEGETATITRVGGKEETRRFLENLGFVVGAIVTVISKTGGNVIVNIKESRVAIGKDMATKIMV
jgi:ferrous iron transport protein A